MVQDALPAIAPHQGQSAMACQALDLPLLPADVDLAGGEPEPGLRFPSNQFWRTGMGHRPLQGLKHPWKQEARASTDPSQGPHQIGRSKRHGVAAIEPQTDAGPTHTKAPQAEAREEPSQLAPLPIGVLKKEIIGPFETPLKPQSVQLAQQAHRHGQPRGGGLGLSGGPGQGGTEPHPTRG